MEIEYEVRTSPPIPPEASRFVCIGLKSRLRTGPVWVVFLKIRDSALDWGVRIMTQQDRIYAPSAGENLSGIPECQLTILETCSNYALRTGGVDVAPCEAIEPSSDLSPNFEIWKTRLTLLRP